MTQSPPFAPPSAALADVVSDSRSLHAGALHWVGMHAIELPLRIDAGGEPFRVPGKVSAYVDLADAGARGIHMSRLYRACDDILGSEAVSHASLERLLDAFLQSHAGLSTRARLRLQFELPLRRPSLLSGLHGWRQYPVRIDAQRDGDATRIEAEVQVLYSSTCPGSAALARQLVQQRHARDFGMRDEAAANAEIAAWLGAQDALCATPHAQRSLATVRVRWTPEARAVPLVALVDTVEAALMTPVQAAVKRIDEQEFARLNGENPMYCEDAARRIRAALEAETSVADYWIRAAHLESLHPHDAVAVAVRGVAGGFVADIE
ncbi:GTP cyclohydrolase FolE2 [Chiayiivirga flava]|uniref:GTP cyclohydrolase FolE2 n=1 Tax=Chiayiivirga flava TaxID=659595 RepID=A0A7W8G0M8_9GAMM|nr:GTP cyclohydrolase FolE2 [Chiayiivirga flava]MBB5206810.1 GTP cyclohydrolase I [Chiayiivirga flava]